MSSFTEFYRSVISNYHTDSVMIQNIQGYLNDKMKADGWISLTLSNRIYIAKRFSNGEFTNEGYVVNDENVLTLLGNGQIGNVSYNEQSIIVNGIVNLDNGARFEGLVLTVRNGKKGIPFGYGEMYDDNGKLIYKGIMINWKRFGYGTSYSENGLVEYEGYWCDNNRCGRGKKYYRQGKLVKECEWYNGNEIDIDKYEGNGRKPINIGIKHLKLRNHCMLKEWDISWFLNLESINIGDDCFGSVKTFYINGLDRLKTIKIGRNSFTQKKNSARKNKSKSFHLLNCKSLKFIQIDRYSFSDYAGVFTLQNLPQLQFIQFGIIEGKSYNFRYSSFMIQGIDII